MNDRLNPASLVVGGAVTAIIPQSIEETWRVATMIVEGGLAPQSLVGKEPHQNATEEQWRRWGKKATSAVAIVIMSGAELGMPPMVALRSFTVINGNPSLKGDALINVVRASGKAKYVETGYIHAATPEALIKLGLDADKVATMRTADERSIGWCRAQRVDTGEKKIEVFSIANAKRAGLWDERQTVRRKKWNSDDWEDKPNDAPWHRYPERMPMWRAAGFCLRDLFADVLGGIRDEWEAREIDGEFERLDESGTKSAETAKRTPPSPPSPPSPQPSGEQKAAETVTETGASTAGIQEKRPFDLESFLHEIDDAMATGQTDDEITEIWDGFDVEAALTDDEDALQRAFDLRKRHVRRAESSAQESTAAQRGREQQSEGGTRG